MLIVTTDSIPGKNIINTLGLVKGSTVRTKHLGKDISAAFKNLAGGEVKEYNEMMIEARQIAIGRMAEEAESIGANAIVGVRLQSASVMNGAAEMVAYGTAVVVE
ncbi:MAG: YbjQ family protein [Peptostreptococcaceae bacterium]